MDIEIHKLPNDIIKKIISYLDIDSRRALGIYAKLIVPETIKQKLDFVFTKHKIKKYKTRSISRSYIRLSSIYTIIREFFYNSKQEVYRLDYCVIYYNNYSYRIYEDWFNEFND